MGGIGIDFRFFVEFLILVFVLCVFGVLVVY